MKQGIVDLQQFLPNFKSKSNFHVLFITFLFIGIFILFFSQILFSNSLLGADGLIPAYFKIDNWSNLIFAGYPLVADPLWGAFYPLRIISRFDFNSFIISGYILMALFTYAYVYFLTELKIAAFVSAIIFSFSGYAIFEMEHAAYFIHTICWLPLVLLSFEKLKNSVSYFWISVGVLATTMTIMGGFPQLSLAILPVLLGYALLLSFETDHKFKNTLFYLSIMTAGYLLAFPQIIPTFVLGLSSARKNLPWEYFASYYVEFKQLLLFNFPYLMGGYHGIYSKNPIIANWEMVGNHGFVGFFSMILAGLGLVKSTPHARLVSYYWLLFCIISVLIALGPELGILYKILFHLPVVNNFRAPERYLFIFSFGISVLAGLGINVMIKGLISSARQKKIIFIASLFFASVLLGLVIAIYPSLESLALKKFQFQLPSLFTNPAVFMPLIWITLSLAALLYWLRLSTSWVRCFIACMVLIGELLYTASFGYWHPVHSYWTKEGLSNPPALLTELRNDLNESNQRYLIMRHSPDLIDKYLGGNYAMYYNLPYAAGYTNLVPLRYLEFLQISDSGENLYHLSSEKFALNQAINLAGIKYLITTPTPLNDIWFKDKTRFQLRKTIGNMLVYENLKALPRAWFTSKLITMPANEILQTIHLGKFSDGSLFNPAEVALVESRQYFNFEKDSTAIARIEKLDNNQLIINTKSEKPQFLVAGDVYFHGWKAYIDKKPVNIFQVDYVLRGIAVPAGKHTIVFEFRPSYLFKSFAIALLTVLVLLFAFIWHFIKNRAGHKSRSHLS
ncbi:MAG: YfhO family protein [Tatlockia sp.]|nr:YfhO family protein [Tatlockia sp.]